MMSRLLALALLLACTVPAAAETFYLDAKATEPKGRRFYLLKYGAVTVAPGTVQSFQLSMETCPGGVDSLYAHYVNPSDPGAWDYRVGWGHPLDYDAYEADTYVTITNYSAAPMTFRLKVSVRCEE